MKYQTILQVHSSLCPSALTQASAGVPEWAPLNEDHILYSEGILKGVQYAEKQVKYSAAAENGVEYLRLSFRPDRVTINGKEISVGRDLIPDAIQYVHVFRKLAEKLDAIGMGDIRFVAPDAGSERLFGDCLDEMVKDEYLMGKLECWGVHQYGNDAAINAYYRLLNCGFRLGWAAGTDFPCNDSRPFGSLLTYVQVKDQPMTYGKWIEWPCFALCNLKTADEIKFFRISPYMNLEPFPLVSI